MLYAGRAYTTAAPPPPIITGVAGMKGMTGMTGMTGMKLKPNKGAGAWCTTVVWWFVWWWVVWLVWLLVATLDEVALVVTERVGVLEMSLPRARWKPAVPPTLPPVRCWLEDWLVAWAMLADPSTMPTITPNIKLSLATFESSSVTQSAF